MAAEPPQRQQPEGPTDAAAVPQEQNGVILAGKYKLVERIGEGGMGSVWMAQQTEPVKRMVAVKLIKVGNDSKAILARFEAERQALALMDHPNIARVLDGGTAETGRPFLVMELVKGVPIAQFCDARKLTARQRLELFVPVCQAIQHAHQKGIIHRDVKPSNVLVAMYDDRPVPKVIDFGVAKAAGIQLTDKSLHTGFGAIVGTPQYMSPEQATLNNLDIDTRSDIYSLGVLLYVLMTGSPPFRMKDLEKAGMLEILRVIREEEPPKPSTKVSTAEALPSLAATRSTEPAKLSRQLRGEIDWIVMKALEKDRARRYETANGFAMDIQRYLADEPVQAGPPSAAYRLKKFVKRHKGQVLAACLVLLVLLGGIAGTTWGLVRAETARNSDAGHRRIAEEKQHEAEEQKEKAQKAEKETLEDYRASTDDAIEQLIGSKPVLGAQEKTYLEKTLKRWQAFAGRIGDDERSRAVRSEGQYRVALLRTRLGQTEEAVAGYHETLAVSQKLADEFPAVPIYRWYVGAAQHNLGNLLQVQNQSEKAAEQYHKAQVIRQKLADEFPAVSSYRNALANTHCSLGNLLQRRNQGAKAAEQYQKALTIQEKLADEFPVVPAYRRDLALTYGNLGVLLGAQNQVEKAAGQHHKALDIQQKLADEFPAVPEYRSDLANTHNSLAILLARQNQVEKATEQFHKALAVRQKLADEFPAVPMHRKDLAQTHYNLGFLLYNQNQGEKAIEQSYKALRIFQKLVDEYPAVPEYHYVLATTHNSLGIMMMKQNQPVKAGEHNRKALGIQEKLADEFPSITAYQVNLGGGCCNYGNLLLGSGKAADSLPWFDKAIRTLSRVHQQAPRVVTPREFLCYSHEGRAQAYYQLKKYAESVKEWDRAIELSPRQKQPLFRVSRTDSLVRAGQFVDAVAEVADLTKAGNWNANQWYGFACVYAVASGKIADKKQEYADRAMVLLHQAVKVGYKDAAHLAKDKDLDALRQRDDFKKLLAVLDAAAKPKKTKEP